MDAVELHNLIKVWSLAIASLCYCFYISSRLPKGLFRLISLLPIFFIFLILPLNLSSFHFCGPTSFLLAWLANFKLFLFCFDQGPLSPLPPNVFHFISMASLPIKAKPNAQNHPNTEKKENPIQNKALRPQKSTTFHVPNSILSTVKVLLLAVLFHSYNYKHHLPHNLILVLYCIHTYLEVEIILALCAIPARVIFGSEIEPQFNEPYLATSLQDFWGHRWNLMVTSILRPTVYHPIQRIFIHILGPCWVSLPAVVTVFVVSGLMHELLYYYLTRVCPTWEVTWFFILHGVAVTIEVVVKKMMPLKWRLHPIISTLLTLGFVAVTGVWLFFPQLLRNKVDEKAIKEYFILVDVMKNVLRL